jgi:ribonuclease P protein component
VIFGCSIPKKKIPGAVKRNKLKRRIKEAYRLNKKDIIQYLLKKNVQIAIVFIYLDNKETDYQSIETKLTHLLQIIKENYS